MSDSGKPDAPMFVKDFAAEVANIAAEVCCDGAGHINSHKISSHVWVELDGEIHDVIGVDVDRLMGCGCWSGMTIRAARSPALTTTPEQEREVDEALSTLGMAYIDAHDLVMQDASEQAISDAYARRNALHAELRARLLASCASEEGIYG